MHFAKKNLIWIYIIKILLLYGCFVIGDRVYSDIVSEKYSIVDILIDLGAMGVIAMTLSLIFSDDYYIVSSEYLVERVGLIQNRVRFSDIKTIRWAQRGDGSSGGGLTSSTKCLVIVEKNNAKLKVSPQDITGFLNLIRERCPDAEIITDELPPKTFTDTIQNVIIFLLIAFAFHIFLK